MTNEIKENNILTEDTTAYECKDAYQKLNQDTIDTYKKLGEKTKKAYREIESYRKSCCRCLQKR